ncbi:MAG: BamA/TamA family outer membrane protein [Candidatus Neomarinimicrobiota bacterium]|nr:BamA/TamA family outer membrane protein [Candidatus Neomarinimicrobiota bacterium]
MIHRRNVPVSVLAFSALLQVSLHGQISTTKYTVGSVTFEGNSSLSSRELRTVVKLKEPKLWNRTEFNRRSLKLDAFNVRNFYQTKGFLSVVVEESFEIQEDNSAIIVFKIEEGPRTILRSAVVEGNSLIDKKRILRLLGLRIGRPLNLTALGHNYAVLEYEYHKFGKLMFSMEHSYRPGEEIDLTLLIYEGPDVYIDSVAVIGLENVDTLFVLRELAFKSGDRYNSEYIQLSERQLFETSLFSLVDIVPIKNSRSGNWVDITVDVRELSKRDLMIEPGFAHIPSSSSGGEPVSGIEGSVRLVDRSIYNTGVRLGLRSSVDFPIDALVNRGSVPVIFRSDLSFTNNWIMSLRAPNTVRFFVDRAPELLRVDEPITRYGVEWTGLKRYSEESVLRGGLSWTRIISDRMTAEQQQKEQQRSISFLFRHRELDNLISPSNGWSLTLDSEVVGWILGGTHDYYKLEFDYRRYLPLSKRRVLAFRSKIGRMDRLNKESLYIPSYDLFYLGGSTSLRGWPAQRYLTSVKDGVERPVGGLIKVLFSSEVRIPLSGLFGVDLFVDGGILAVSLNELGEQFDAWKQGEGWNYGAELTISTPLGPIRFYYAVPFGHSKGAIVNLGVPYAF